MMPNREKIIEDVFEKINEKVEVDSSGIRKSEVCEDPYKNFITFITNSFNYANYANMNKNIVDFVGNFRNLELYYNTFNKYNVYVCDAPRITLYYLEGESDKLKLISETKIVQELQDFQFFEKKTNNTYILYMVRNDGNIRYHELNRDKQYLLYNPKMRLKTERKKKLENIEKKELLNHIIFNEKQF